MLVNELRDELKKYNADDLRKIIVELYKRIPKNKKEDYNIDEYIKNINSKDKKENNKKSMDFESLKAEIIYFLECVDSGYYQMPNRIISKKERSSWRFKVKKYYKELNKITPNSNNGGLATFLLIELFKRLSFGTNSLLFTNWNTFNALGVSQSDYYDTLVKRILFNNYSEENLQKCVELLSVEKDPEEFSYDMYAIFINNLKTIGIKETAIKLLNKEKDNLKENMDETSDYHTKYYIKQSLNNMVMCITEIYFNLHEIDAGISYFHKNYIESNKEILEYVLLNMLDEADLQNEWCLEYEKYLNQLDYRESLKSRYQELKNKMS